jgi:uncharacterized membrane protein YidH (DUF202 family)
MPLRYMRVEQAGTGVEVNGFDKPKNHKNELARLRTHMANQRTTLAYVRTIFSIVAVAVKMDSDNSWVGIVLVCLASGILATGIVQHYWLATHLPHQWSHEKDPSPEMPLSTLAWVLGVGLVPLLSIVAYFVKSYAEQSS